LFSGDRITRLIFIEWMSLIWLLSLRVNPQQILPRIQKR
jgi:hypothetical protein